MRNILLVTAILATIAGSAAIVSCQHMPPAVAHQLETLAGELCVEGDSVQVCARKCSEHAAPPAPASSGEGQVSP